MFAHSPVDVAQVCERAAAEGRASEHLLLEWPKLALQRGQVRGALAAAAAGTALSPASPMLWQQRIILEAQQASSTLQVRAAAAQHTAASHS